MDAVLEKTRLLSLPLFLLLCRGISSAFFITSMVSMAPPDLTFWCVDKSGRRLHNGTDQCHYPLADGVGGAHSCTAWEFERTDTFTAGVSMKDNDKINYGKRLT